MQTISTPEDEKILSAIVQLVDSNLSSYGIDTSRFRVGVDNIEPIDTSIRHFKLIEINISKIRQGIEGIGKRDEDGPLLYYGVMNALVGSVSYKLQEPNIGIRVYPDDELYSTAGWFMHHLFPDVKLGGWAVSKEANALRNVSDHLPNEIRDDITAAFYVTGTTHALPVDKFMLEVINTARRRGHTNFRHWLRMLDEEFYAATKEHGVVLPTNMDEYKMPGFLQAEQRLKESNTEISDEYPVHMRFALQKALDSSDNDPAKFWRSMAEQVARGEALTSFISNILLATVLGSYTSIGEGLKAVVKDPRLADYPIVMSLKALEAAKVLLSMLDTLPVTFHVNPLGAKEKNKT